MMSLRSVASMRFSHHAACFGLFVGSAAATAGTSMDLSDAMRACRAITSNEPRLQCFDRIDVDDKSASSLTPAPALPSSPATSVPLVTSPAAVSAKPASTAAAPVANFGADALPQKAIEQPKTVVAKLVGSVDGIRKGRVFGLDNGQKWKVVDDRDFDYVGNNSPVKLDRNLIGTYWMTFTDGGPRFKVRRIQ